MAAELSALPISRISPSPPSEPPLSGENAVKKPPTVWNKPSGDAACHVIANEESWPALSECTKHQPKSAVDRSPGSSSQEHLISNTKKNKNQNHSNANQNHRPNANQTSTPARQKTKRGGGSGSGPSRNGIIHHPRPLPLSRLPPPPPALAIPLPPPLPPYPIYEGFCPLPPPMPFFVPPNFNGNNWERGSTPMNDRSFQRNFNPRGNYVGRFRGDGAANSGHVSRRDHNRDRNGFHRGFARPVRSPAPPPLPYFPMPPVRPFSDPIGFDMASPYADFPPPPPEFFMRFPPPLPLYVPPMDPALPSNLIKQIDHYFSDDNLAKDSFLRAKMDDEGWVDIAVIAAFPKVRQMTQNLQLILDSLKDSTAVEVQGYRIRRRNDWRKWVMTVPRSSTGSSSASHVVSAEDKLSKSLESVKLGDETNPIDVKVASSSNVSQSDVA